MHDSNNNVESEVRTKPEDRERESEREKMVNIITLFKSLLRPLLKLTGVEPVKVEINPPGTVINFWATVKPKNEDGVDRNNPTPSVVLLHGFGADGILTWIFQVLALRIGIVSSRRWRYSVYVPDLLFFGDSSTTAAGKISPAFQAECVAAGLRKLGVERCVVVGLSYGGLVAFKMAELCPDLVEAVVVTGFLDAFTESLSNARLKELGRRRWSDVLLPTTADGVKELFTFATHYLPSWIPHRIFKDFLEAMFSHRRERGELLEALVIRDQDYTPFHYHQRVYLIWGDGDKILPLELARTLKQQMGEKVKLECIENAGHLPQLERPWVFNTHLKQILASLT